MKIFESTVNRYFLWLFDEHGEEDAKDQNTQDNSQRSQCRDVPAEELATNHLHADEGEQDTESVMQHPEAVGHVAQEEEE